MRSVANANQIWEIYWICFETMYNVYLLKKNLMYINNLCFKVKHLLGFLYWFYIIMKQIVVLAQAACVCHASLRAPCVAWPLLFLFYSQIYIIT